MDQTRGRDHTGITARRGIEGRPGIGRRDFLLGGAALPLLGRSARAQGTPGPAEGRQRGLIVRESSPLNLESRFAGLGGFLTPNDEFYVRCHFPIPALDAASWRLKVEGAVERPSEFDLAALHRMPSRTVTALLECAGNGRVFLVPRARGILWETGAVGNAEWTGVPLGAVLDHLGLKENAAEVVLEGHDRGEIADDPKTPGEIPFARSLPLAKARRDVLLAFRMNGQDLAPRHGFPVRAIVPGWYGMASVKWLSRIVVVDRPFAGYFQTFDYTYFERTHGLPTLVPVTENEVKSQVARPSREEVVPKGRAYRVQGAAWSGEAAVAKVEVSTDGGKAWAEAELTGEPVPHAWRLWGWTWQTPKAPGTALIMSRATDTAGRVQPMTRDKDRRTTRISHVVPVEVEIS